MSIFPEFMRSALLLAQIFIGIFVNIVDLILT